MDTELKECDVTMLPENRPSSTCEDAAKEFPHATIEDANPNSHPEMANAAFEKTGEPQRHTRLEESSNEQGQELASAAALQLARWRIILVVLSLCIGTLLVAIDTTIVSTAIPRIATEFKSLDDVGWYGSAYLFTVTAFQPAFGSIYRFFDAKWSYLSSVVLFELGSVLAATSPSSPVFILGRAIQGVGAAGLYQGALAIIGLTVSLAKRPMTIGIVLSVFGLAVCFGPPVGGLLTDNISWRWCFWMQVDVCNTFSPMFKTLMLTSFDLVSNRNLPIGAAAFIVLLFILKPPDKADDNNRDASKTFKQKISCLDIPGIILIIGAVCCLVFALQWGGQSKSWNSADVVGTLAGAVLLLGAFSIVQWKKGESATIPFRIFRQRTILMGAWYLFFLEMAIYAYLFYLPYYFQSAQLVNAEESGIRSIPLGLSQIVAVVLCSSLVTHVAYYVPFMIAGQLVAIIGNVFLARLTVDTKTAVWATFLVVTGIGTGMGLQMPFTGVQLVLEKDDIPVGNAIIVFLQQLGAAIAVAIGENVFSDSLSKKLVDIHVPFPAKEVIAVGPTGIRLLTMDDTVIQLIQQAYCFAFDMTMYFALAALIAAIPFAVGMQWLNAKPSKVHEEA